MNNRMFAQLLLTVVTLPLVSALTLVTPSVAVSGQPLTLLWTTVTGDPPTFILLLTNSAKLVLQDNVDVALLSTTVTLPVVQDTPIQSRQSIKVTLPLYMRKPGNSTSAFS
ncbi:hypothetical protein EDC04DRAFT_1768822 [Pisolithus marmoratus]|nr:hypothetical protein EDC04DRAFT_1768822 [Pisolithus marmoratus]